MQIVLLVASAYFVMYATKNYVLNSNRTHSILSILGCPTSTLAGIIFSEVAILFLISAAMGLAVGGGVLYAVWSYIGSVGFAFPFDTLLSPEILLALLVNTAAICVIAIPNLATMSSDDFSSRVVNQDKRDTITENTWVYFVVGVSMFALAVYFGKKTHPVYFLLSIFLVLAGTSLIFSRGMIALYHGLKKSTGIYYNHLLLINNFFSRFQQSRKMLFITFIVGFLIFYSGCYGLSYLMNGFGPDHFAARFPNDFVILAKSSSMLDAQFANLINEGTFDPEKSLLFEGTQAQITTHPDQGQFFDERKTLCISEDTLSAFTGNHYQLQPQSVMILGLYSVEEFKSFEESWVYLTDTNHQRRYSYRVMHSEWVKLFGDFRGQDSDMLIVMNPDDYLEYARENPMDGYSVLVANLAHEEQGIAAPQVIKDLRENNPAVKVLNGKWFAALYYSESTLTVFSFAILAFFLLIYVASVTIVGLNAEMGMLRKKYRTAFLLGMGTKAIKRSLTNDTCLPVIVSVTISIIASTIIIEPELVRTYGGGSSAYWQFFQYYALFVVLYVLVMTLFYATTTGRAISRSVREITKGGYDDSN